MSFNLIERQWIPVRTRHGTRKTIAPRQITEGSADDPIVALDAPRADFNAALIQFLIGLAQTCIAPETKAQWRKWFRDPPTPEVLQSGFSDVADAFNLDGDGPRFMQDLELREGDLRPLEDLLVDLTGNSHFIKPRVPAGLCLPCCATALFCLQTNSPEGGRGHFTSVRGGGPLTTLVKGQKDNLWHTVWLNTLISTHFLGQFVGLKESKPDKFPWLAPTRTGESNKSTTPADAHPSQIFWSMPRRIRIDFSDTEPGNCQICRAESDTLVQTYITRPYGVRYEGPWVHPLSPYIYDKHGLPQPRHARAGGLNYRQWLGLVQEDASAGKSNPIIRKPAAVVRVYQERRPEGQSLRLWAFGYDMDHMKAKCWYEGAMPLPGVKSEISDKFQGSVARMVRTAIVIGGNLGSCLKAAWFKRTKDVKGDTGFVDWEFWGRTEPGFFGALRALEEELLSDPEQTPVAPVTLGDWHKRLCTEALRLFDEYATRGPIEDEDPKRIAVARNKLNGYNRAQKVYDILGLAKPEKKQQAAETPPGKGD